VGYKPSPATEVALAVASEVALAVVSEVALAVASEIELGFSPASSAAAKRPNRSAEGRSKARRAKRLNIAFVFAVVLALAFFFCVFSPKNACQAQKPSKPLKQKEIEFEI
jgi:hypothetical protein